MGRPDVEDRIAAAAAAQHGVVTFAQLRAAGLSAPAIGRRAHAGRLRPLHRGVYLGVPFALPGTREMAAVLASGPDAVLSYLDAARQWVPDFDRGGCALVHVSVRVKRGKRPGIRLHHAPDLAEAHCTVHDGIPITTPARTILDVAAVLGSRELERIIARAERERLLTLDELASLLERSCGRRGLPVLRKILGMAGGPALTRSEAERQLLELLRKTRLPRPEMNAKFLEYEIDFFWPRAKLAVEVDGFRHHSTRPRFEGDRRKDADLVAHGLTVLRLTWRQITEEPLATIGQLGQALGSASGLA